MNFELRNKEKRVAVCDGQPLTVYGLSQLLASTSDLRLVSAHASPAEWMMSSRAEQTDLLVVDKGLGIQHVLDTLTRSSAENGGVHAPRQAVVVWGLSITEAEALRFIQLGAKGILRKSADTVTILACLRAVAQGKTWMQDCVFRDCSTAEPETADLTPRERQVMELVEQGYKNREIAQELGIRPGTVKIHLKHIFEKTGVRGRHGLALNGLRQKGVISLLAS
jgi:two-component system, NarL family, nitrate/nitrite response regulator NarL